MCVVISRILSINSQSGDGAAGRRLGQLLGALPIDIEDHIIFFGQQFLDLLHDVINIGLSYKRTNLVSQHGKACLDLDELIQR